MKLRQKVNIKNEKCGFLCNLYLFKDKRRPFTDTKFLLFDI